MLQTVDRFFAAKPAQATSAGGRSSSTADVTAAAQSQTQQQQQHEGSAVPQQLTMVSPVGRSRLAQHLRQSGIAAADAGSLLSTPQPELLLQQAEETYRKSISSAISADPEYVATTLTLQHLQQEENVPVEARVKLPPTPGMLAGAESKALRTISDGSPHSPPGRRRRRR